MTQEPVVPKPAPTSILSRFLLHLHPPRVATETLRFNLSFGLGGISTTLVFLLLLSGMVQLLAYLPTPNGAHSSVAAMYGPGMLSGWIRNIHYWSANLLVITSVLHGLRVYLTGAVSTSRAGNWCLGLLLFTLILAANFTGYLLPLDQRAYWAVTIFLHMIQSLPFWGADLAAGTQSAGLPNGGTLSLFYGLHIGIFPCALFCTAMLHFYQVRKNGGLIRRKSDPSFSHERVDTVPFLVSREAAIGFATIGLIALTAALYDAPLGAMANPGVTPNPAKAAWYFLGFQELLMHIHPLYAVGVLPALLLFWALCLPWLGNAQLAPGIWCGGRRGIALVTGAIASGFLVTFGLVLFNEAAQAGNNLVPSLGQGSILIGTLLLGCGALWLILIKVFRLSQAHALMAGNLFIFGSICCLTALALWLRGAEMRLLFF